MFSTLAIPATLAAIGLAAALPSPWPRSTQWTDPPFSVSTDAMASSVTCPRGIQGRAGGVVFLVHGTGT